MFNPQVPAGAMVPGSTLMPEWRGWSQVASVDLTAQLEQLRLARLGRELLGWVEVSYEQGTQVLMRWERRAAERVVGLPPATVDPARDAAIAEERARLAQDAAADTANAWLMRNRPADGRPHPLMAAEHAEATTRHREAEQIAARALVDLGRVAEELASIRAELAAIPTRIRQRRQECAQQEAADLRADSDLRARLARFGLTE